MASESPEGTPNVCSRNTHVAASRQSERKGIRRKREAGHEAVRNQRCSRLHRINLHHEDAFNTPHLRVNIGFGVAAELGETGA